MTMNSTRKILGHLVFATMVACQLVYGNEPPPPIRHLDERFAISAQIRPEQLAELKARGYTTVVAVRPDGEAGDQPSATVIEEAAKVSGVRFVYIPVPSAGISESQIGTLSTAITSDTGKVLAYCRSGNRAARLWSLAEASRSNGRSKDEILQAVKAAGQAGENLENEVANRIALRKTR